MTYKRFEELPVWQDAARLARQVFDLVEDRAFQMRGDLASQLSRAGLSVSNNIAEGFGRGTTKELIAFLFIAAGSVDEVRSMLAVMAGMKRFDSLQSPISNLQSLCESISRQLTGWAQSLERSDVEGRRYYTPQKKADRQRARGRAGVHGHAPTDRKTLLVADHRTER